MKNAFVRWYIIFLSLLALIYFSGLFKIPFVTAGCLMGWFGGSLNFLAHTLNGNKMPSRLGVSPKHTPITNNTRLLYLCDIIPIKGGYMSVGDIFLYTAIALLVLGLVSVVLIAVGWYKV